MNSMAWLLFLALIGLAVYTFRVRKRLHHYRTKLRGFKDAASAMAPAGEQLDTLLVSMNEVVFRLDAKGMVLGANTQAQKVFALADLHFPLPLRQVYRDVDWHSAVQQALSVLPDATTCLPDMNTDEVILSPRLAQLSTGQLLLLCVDVTEQRRLEKQRRTFLSNLMHDLKTPLTSLLGYARSLERFGDDAAFRKDAGTVIADEAKHVNHLLDALLTLDQIEFSPHDSNASCQLADVLEQVFALLRPLYEKHSVTLRCDAEKLPCTLAVLDDELDRVLTNVLVNAMHYSPPDSQVTLAICCVDHMCHLVVEDTGCGIPEHDLPRVTERFYRVDKARTRKAGGHGLGLAIVHELIEKNGGRLKLSNRRTGGLRVEIQLPVNSCSDSTA